MLFLSQRPQPPASSASGNPPETVAARPERVPAVQHAAPSLAMNQATTDRPLDSRQETEIVATPSETVAVNTPVKINLAGPNSGNKAPRPAPVPANATAPYSEILLDRALREARNEAKQAAQSLLREMLAPVQADERSFAEKLYNINSSAKALATSEDKYREYVSARFADEILGNGNLEDNMVAIATEYLYALQRISNHVVIESGADVSDIPDVPFIFKDFEKLVKDSSKQSAGMTAKCMAHESRTSAAVNTIAIGVGIVCPATLIVDLAVGASFDSLINHFRDSTGNIAISAWASAEALATAVCLGDGAHAGFYGYLLEIAQFHNDQLRGLLKETPQADDTDNRDFIFGGSQ